LKESQIYLYMAHVILTVDDEIDFLEVIGTKLESSGFKVLTAQDGEEAIQIVKNEKPDLILMDVQMPKMDGIQAVIEIKKDLSLKDVHVIFLTNLGDAWPSVSDINKRFAQQIGADDYFKKGGDLNQLVDKIKLILG